MDGQLKYICERNRGRLRVLVERSDDDPKKAVITVYKSATYRPIIERPDLSPHGKATKRKIKDLGRKQRVLAMASYGTAIEEGILLGTRGDVRLTDAELHWLDVILPGIEREIKRAGAAY